MRDALIHTCLYVLSAVIIAQGTYYGDSYGHQGDGYYDGYISDWNADWSMGGRANSPKCLDIPTNLTLCRDIGYGQMRLPNLLEHDTLTEVTQQAKSWVPLLGIRCHPDTKLFLCSLFSPVCLDRPIFPCRTLCNAVKSGCEERMSKYGFPWPEMLRCDKFPLDNDLCIGPQNDNKPDETNCAACTKPETFESFVDSFCDADFVVKFKIKEHVVSGDMTKITTLKRKKKLKKKGLKKREFRDMTMYIENGARCECGLLEGKASKKKFFIAMGHKKGEKLVLSFLQMYDKKNKDMRRALKAINNDEICKGGLSVLTEPEINAGDQPTVKPVPVPVELNTEPTLPQPVVTNTPATEEKDEKKQKGKKKKDRKNKKERDPSKKNKKGKKKGEKKDRVRPDRNENRRHRNRDSENNKGRRKERNEDKQ